MGDKHVNAGCFTRVVGPMWLANCPVCGAGRFGEATGTTRCVSGNVAEWTSSQLFRRFVAIKMVIMQLVMIAFTSEPQS